MTFKDNNEMLSFFGATGVREGSRKVLEGPEKEDWWEDYYEVPFHVLDAIREYLTRSDDK